MYSFFPLSDVVFPFNYSVSISWLPTPLGKPFPLSELTAWEGPPSSRFWLSGWGLKRLSQLCIFEVSLLCSLPPGALSSGGVGEREVEGGKKKFFPACPTKSWVLVPTAFTFLP